MGTDTPSCQTLLVLLSGGFLLSGGSNGMNQVFEREWDKLMHRTMSRPLPTGRMSITEGVIISLIAATAGIMMLWLMVSFYAGLLGLSAFLMYVFIYTPMKRVSNLAVFIGAFPGAIAPMLGYVAATNDYTLEAGFLFAMQFAWQFPHFWAIAWVAHDDYERGGYKLLPYNEGRTRRTALQIFVYSLFLVPVSLLPWVFPLHKPMIGNMAAAVAVVAGLWMAWYAFKLYRTCDVKDAKKLMFASFFYLPLVQVFYVIDKL